MSGWQIQSRLKSSGFPWVDLTENLTFEQANETLRCLHFAKHFEYQAVFVCGAA